MNKYCALFFVIAFLIFGCVSPDSSLNSIEQVSDQRRISLTGKYGEGVYYRYRGNVSSLQEHSEDIDAWIVNDVRKLLEADSRFTSACVILNNRPQHYENGFYSVDIRC